MIDKKLAILKKNLSRNIKTARKAIKLSQEQLALEAGVDRTYVSQMERGISNPSLEVLTKVAKVLEMEVVDLLGG